jgi:hypothetical protein
MPTPVESAVGTYIRAVTASEPAEREALLEACLAADVRMVTRSREIRGRAAIISMTSRFLARPEVLRIRVVSEVDAQGTTFRYRAVADLEDGTSPETFDAGEIDAEGRISLILAFAGPLADAPGR